MKYTINLLISIQNNLINELKNFILNIISFKCVTKSNYVVINDERHTALT